MEEPKFMEVAFSCPNILLRFKANKERIRRLASFMLDEATDAQIEYENSLKVLELKSLADPKQDS